jgi:hypothetical protein
MYKLVNDTFTNQLCSISKLKNGVIVLSIPIEPANTDYQEYLKWLEEGNTPLPAEENN